MSAQPTERRWLSALLVILVRLVGATWRLRFENPALLDAATRDGPVILAGWHGEQLPLIYAHRGRGYLALVSHSRDGALLAGALDRLGYRVVRGSSSRGGAEALDALEAGLRQGLCPGLAVDGPRGPRHQPHPGALALSARVGRPIITTRCVSGPALRLRSWDRFEIPLPFARLEVRYGRIDPPSAGERHAPALLVATLNGPASTPP